MSTLPTSPFPMVPADEARAAAAAQPRVTAAEFQRQLSRNLNPGRHGLPHRVQGARRELGRLIWEFERTGNATDPTGALRRLLQQRHQNLDELESLLRCIYGTPAREGELRYDLGGPRCLSREAWLLASEGGLGKEPGPEAQAVTWDGFPYYRYTPWRNPVAVPHIYGGVDASRCAACEEGGRLRGEHDWDSALWVRVVTRTQAGWIVEDAARCGICGVVVESREARAFDGPEHPFLRA